ncbi:hypothetical protein BO83DRAFT_404250 [Aspergillus eucalypticola CBS 122712]|uniref:Uncharacterized protein n=1 Tax=Aspergillus eucalypticola (strain CBS 122712 / IBT 29274) TaxID=1448314 RepID=A0A317UJL9_ASPEC|nr:uncharacterized protein BO83DRAFT_404250 [Aspergillus eucalypticola CBS 122712]PWY61891.1 hypothetical protein BO83DRAFT_404250 [Aspergillus eucalypticola CBS 122712]
MIYAGVTTAGFHTVDDDTLASLDGDKHGPGVYFAASLDQTPIGSQIQVSIRVPGTDPSRPRGGVASFLLCWAHLCGQTRRSYLAISASDRQLVGAIASYIKHTGGHLTGSDGHLAFSTFGVALWRCSRNRPGENSRKRYGWTIFNLGPVRRDSCGDASATAIVS